MRNEGDTTRGRRERERAQKSFFSLTSCRDGEACIYNVKIVRIEVLGPLVCKWEKIHGYFQITQLVGPTDADTWWVPLLWSMYTVWVKAAMSRINSPILFSMFLYKYCFFSRNGARDWPIRNQKVECINFLAIKDLSTNIYSPSFFLFLWRLDMDACHSPIKKAHKYVFSQ